MCVTLAASPLGNSTMVSVIIVMVVNKCTEKTIIPSIHNLIEKTERVKPSSRKQEGSSCLPATAFEGEKKKKAAQV